MSNAMSIYCIQYFREDHEEDIIEIPAYSFEQALLIGNIHGEQVIDYECFSKRYATG